MSYFVDKNKLAARNSIKASSFLSHNSTSAEEFIGSKFNALICEVVKKEVVDQLKAFNFTQERNSTSNNNNLFFKFTKRNTILTEEILSKNKVINLLLTEVKTTRH